MNKKIMCNITRDINSCPVCGHKIFIGRRMQVDTFLTDSFGDISDYVSDIDKAVCICTTCHREFYCVVTNIGIVPLTKMHKIIYNAPTVQSDTTAYNNPMLLERSK